MGVPVLNHRSGDEREGRPSKLNEYGEVSHYRGRPLEGEVAISGAKNPRFPRSRRAC